jgi:hypothetical protein
MPNILTMLLLGGCLPREPLPPNSSVVDTSVPFDVDTGLGRDTELETGSDTDTEWEPDTEADTELEGFPDGVMRAIDSPERTFECIGSTFLYEFVGTTFDEPGNWARRGTLQGTTIIRDDRPMLGCGGPGFLTFEDDNGDAFPLVGGSRNGVFTLDELLGPGRHVTVFFSLSGGESNRSRLLVVRDEMGVVMAYQYDLWNEWRPPPPDQFLVERELVSDESIGPSAWERTYDLVVGGVAVPSGYSLPVIAAHPDLRFNNYRSSETYWCNTCGPYFRYSAYLQSARPPIGP